MRDCAAERSDERRPEDLAGSVVGLGTVTRHLEHERRQQEVEELDVRLVAEHVQPPLVEARDSALSGEVDELQAHGGGDEREAPHLGLAVGRRHREDAVDDVLGRATDRTEAGLVDRMLRHECLSQVHRGIAFGLRRAFIAHERHQLADSVEQLLFAHCILSRMQTAIGTGEEAGLLLHDACDSERRTVVA